MQAADFRPEVSLKNNAEMTEPEEPRKEPDSVMEPPGVGICDPESIEMIWDGMTVIVEGRDGSCWP